MRAELLRLPGVLAVSYDKERDEFALRYESVLIKLEDIFAAVFRAGKQMGREYFPEISR